jgi:hypothetical protein
LTRAARRRGCFGHGHSLNSIIRTCSRRKTTRPQRSARGALRRKPIARRKACRRRRRHLHASQVIRDCRHRN